MMRMIMDKYDLVGCLVRQEVVSEQQQAGGGITVLLPISTVKEGMVSFGVSGSCSNGVVSE
jgi:hypothetical protein